MATVWISLGRNVGQDPMPLPRWQRAQQDIRALVEHCGGSLIFAGEGNGIWQDQLDLSKPRVMGIVNVTPDSFSDGGKFNTTEKAIEHALQLVEEGADILDIGGESTRPGATPVPLDEELNRVIPVIEGLRHVGVPLSIDTYKPQVMQAAIVAGADIVNDVCALRETQALEIVAASQAGVCLMHMQGRPQTMQADPQYDDVVKEVKDFLAERLAALDFCCVMSELTCCFLRQN